MKRIDRIERIDVSNPERIDPLAMANMLNSMADVINSIVDWTDAALDNTDDDPSEHILVDAIEESWAKFHTMKIDAAASMRMKNDLKRLIAYTRRLRVRAYNLEIEVHNWRANCDLLKRSLAEGSSGVTDPETGEWHAHKDDAGAPVAAKAKGDSDA